MSEHRSFCTCLATQAVTSASLLQTKYTTASDCLVRSYILSLHKPLANFTRWMDEWEEQPMQAFLSIDFNLSNHAGIPLNVLIVRGLKIRNYL